MLPKTFLDTAGLANIVVEKKLVMWWVDLWGTKKREKRKS